MVKVLANDGLPATGIDVFNEAGIEVDTQKREGESALVDAILDLDGLIVRSATKVTRSVLEAGRDRLKVVGRAGVGYDNVDVDAASEYGVLVKYAPHGNTNGAAEHAVALMLAVSRQIPQAHYDLSSGMWVKKTHMGVELSGKTLGIIGCGRIGQRLNQLVMGFGMDVIGYDLKRDPDSSIPYVDSVEELLGRSDYVSLHSGGKDVLIGVDELGMMKSNAILVNTSRGKNVDEAALRTALEGGKIAGAGIDVYVTEGGEGQEFHHPYEGLDNVVVTPHLGASTQESQRRTAIEVAEKVRDYLLTGDWSGAVNAKEFVAAEGKTIYPLFITHKDKPEMFGKISTILGQHDVNIRDNPSRKLGHNSKVQTVYQLHQSPTEQVFTDLRLIDGVYFVKK